MSEGSAGSDVTIRKLLFWLAQGISDQTGVWVMVGPGIVLSINGDLIVPGRNTSK